MQKKFWAALQRLPVSQSTTVKSNIFRVKTLSSMQGMKGELVVAFLRPRPYFQNRNRRSVKPEPTETGSQKTETDRSIIYNSALIWSSRIINGIR